MTKHKHLDIIAKFVAIGVSLAQSGNDLRVLEPLAKQYAATISEVRWAHVRISLVTGGAGFIGSHLVDFLLSNGDKVVVLDDLSTGDLSNLKHLHGHPHLDVIVDTVLNESVVAQLIARADRVFHLAAVVGVRLIVSEPIRVIETNVNGTAVVLRACATSLRPVFLASSSEVYGKSDLLPFRENDDSVFGPSSEKRWSYGATKLVGEFLGQAFSRTQDLPIVTARLFNTTGPRQKGAYGMVVPRFVEQALAGQPITVYGDGRQTRCFCHVSDVVDAIVRMMDTKGCLGEIINLGQADPVAIHDLAQRVRTLTSSSSEIHFVPFVEAYQEDLADMRDRRPDLTKVRTLIGFRPKHHLDDIIRDIAAYQTVASVETKR